MRALYKPKNIDEIPEAWLKAEGIEFNFKLAFKLNNGDEYYTSNDINFPTGDIIKASDLEFIK